MKGMNNMTDITFDLKGTVISLRAGALIRHSRQVLICRPPEERWWYVPGGSIVTGETSLEAIKRELEEEIQGNYEIEQPSLFAESFFTVDNRRYQQFCVYYEVSWLGSPADLVGKSHEEFRWVKVRDLRSYPLKPDYIASVLTKKPSTLRHMIFRDIQQGGA